jgi:hypothetical protein
MWLIPVLLAAVSPLTMADALDRSISPPSQIIDLLDCMNELKVSVTGLALCRAAAPSSCRLSCAELDSFK